MDKGRQKRGRGEAGPEGGRRGGKAQERHGPSGRGSGAEAEGAAAARPWLPRSVSGAELTLRSPGRLDGRSRSSRLADRLPCCQTLSRPLGNSPENLPLIPKNSLLEISLERETYFECAYKCVCPEPK